MVSPYSIVSILMLLIFFLISVKIFEANIQMIKVLLFLELLSTYFMFANSFFESSMVENVFGWFLLMVVIVCEASAGLGVMVFNSRKFGSQSISF